MSIGEKLLELRKKKGLSQEEVAYQLNVTRQTISKWETDQSTPDFDKIAPLCELYEISADELLTGKINTSEVLENNTFEEEKVRKNNKAKGISASILIYFLAVVWIMISIPVFFINPILASAIFLLICGIATYIMVYTCIVYKKKKTEVEEKVSKLEKQINHIISIIVLIIYLLISFTTMAWHITWMIWIIYGLIAEIIKLIFMLRGSNYEK